MSNLKRGIIEAEKPQQCDDCGELAELRPYGPGGSCICHECGMKDPAGVQAAMKAAIDEFYDRRGGSS